MEGLEDVWDVHDRENIIFLGWIHTHPEYDVFLSRCYQCVVHLPTSSSFLFLLFLSSVDMHNQYEWQHMLPEALAIVCRCCNCQDLCSFSWMFYFGLILHVQHQVWQNGFLEFDGGWLAGNWQMWSSESILFTSVLSPFKHVLNSSHIVYHNQPFLYQGELPPSQQGATTLWGSNPRRRGSWEQGHP